jgi:hypothetical protein
MRPSLVSVPDGHAISSSARVSSSGLTPTRTTVTPLASPRAFDAGVQQVYTLDGPVAGRPASVQERQGHDHARQ